MLMSKYSLEHTVQVTASTDFVLGVGFKVFMWL